MGTVQPELSPRVSSWKKLLGKLEHKRWGWVLSALAAFFATVSSTVIRILCLMFAVVMAGIAFHRTQIAAGKWKKTAPAILLFIVVAAGLFFGANYFDKRVPAELQDHSLQPQVTSKDAPASAAIPRETSDTTKSDKQQTPTD